MFGMLRMAFTLLICILAVGFYLGWFSFTKAPPDPQSDKVNINVSVDKQKMGADLQTFEQKMANRIQQFNNQPQPNGQPAPLGQQSTAPKLNFGPISVQPSGQPGQTTSGPTSSSGWSVGPFSVQPTAPATSQPGGLPQLKLETQDYQFNVPLGAPPPGEGR
jgi:hypothetical protein